MNKISTVTGLIIQVHGFTCDKNMRNHMTNNIKNAFLCCFIFTRSTNLQKNICLSYTVRETDEKN